jgi:HlyD family secretion protein
MIRKITVSFVSLAALGAVVFFLMPGGLFSGAGATGEDVVMTPKPLSFWADATGVLRATSIRYFGGPPGFRNYWQFQIVSMVPEGKNVKKGEVLVRFDAQRIREDLQRAQNQMDQATKELEKTSVETDLAAQELTARLAEAETRYEKLKLKQLSVTGVESLKKVEEDRVAFEHARRDVETLKRRLAAHQQANEANIKIIASKKAQAENEVNELKRGIESFQITADRDGVVVYKTKWNGEKFQVGENVWSGWPVIEIPDLNTILAEAFVPEVDIGKIKVGQRVELTIDAFPGKSYSGTVKSMGTLVRPKAWDIPNKVLDVQIALEQLDTSVMRPAMSIKAKIETAHRSSVLAVPLKAVRTTGEGTLVKVKDKAGWREQKVKLGESNGVEVIVPEGLKPGDRVASDFAKAK